MFVYLKIAVSVSVGDVDENVHVALLSGLMMRVLVGISRQSFSKALNCARVEPAGNLAIHVSSVGIAIWPPTVGGLHGVVTVTVVVPSGQVIATAQASCS